MSDETKPLDLELIRARAKRCAPVSGSTSMQVVYGDVPALVVEVERLREALKPFAAIWDHHVKAGYATTDRVGRQDVLHGFHLVHGESAELRFSDCKRAKELLP